MTFRYALRRLLRAPGFTLACVLTLALGIGATTAIFSVIEAVILRPLPYPEPDRLIMLDHAAPGANLANTQGAPFLYYTYAEDAKSWRSVAMFNHDTLSITGLQKPERADILIATHELFPMLGVKPALGRVFGAAEDRPESSKTVVLSWEYWQSRFGGARDAIGRRITGDSESREIIGVLPRGFRFLDIRADLYLPMRADRAKVHLGGFGTPVVGRLKPGVTLQQAAAEGLALVPVALHKFPVPEASNLAIFEKVGIRPVFRTMRDGLIGDSRRFLWILLGTISIVLLIACANVANLMLVRADGRRQELAVRAALGAGTGRLAGELIADSVVLAALGGAAGIALAALALRLLVTLGPANVPRLEEVALDGPVLLFALAITVFSALVFGTLPALRYAGSRLAGGLRGSGRTASESRERHRSRGALVVTQVAMAMVLALGAGLMWRTFAAMRTVQPGFTASERVQTFRISIPEPAVKDDRAAVRAENDILDRVKRVPGVEAAALYSKLPMDMGTGWTDPLFIEGRRYAEGELPALVRYRFASPGLTQAMGAALLAGRETTWTDAYEGRKVAVANEAFAKKNWQTAAGAVGKRFRESPRGQWREIVGVIADEFSDGVAEPAPPAVYFPMVIADFDQNPTLAWREPFVVVRSARAGSAALMDDLRKAVWEVNPNLPLADVRTLKLLYDRSTARTSFTLVLLGLACGMALLLSLVGVYGVIAYSVARRRREIGIRSALGAQPGQLVRAFAGQGVGLAGVGVAFGALAAWPLTKLLQSMLFRISPGDPLTWAVVIPALFVAAALASWLPARRTVRVDASEALRSE